MQLNQFIKVYKEIYQKFKRESNKNQRIEMMLIKMYFKYILKIN